MRYGHLSTARRGVTGATRFGAAERIWGEPRRRLAWPVACLLAIGAALAAPSGGAGAADPLEVVSLLISDKEIGAAGQQIVQVTLRGTGSRPARAGLRVEIRDNRDRPVGPATNRVVQVAAGGEQREFFRFDVPNRFGRFVVRLEVFTPDFKSRLLSGGPVFYAPFHVGSPVEPGLAAQPRQEAPPETPPGKPGKAGPPNFHPPAGLNFEKPDLAWENLDIQPPNLLVGESLKIKADLRNVGGDIARSVDVKVDYFNLRTPAHLVAVGGQTVQVLAPGDKVEMEFETVFPEDAALGEYKVRLVIDPDRRIAEVSKENNVLVSDVPIKLSLIKQIFPEPGYYFEQSGLFLFRWDSRRFDEFKVQVGTDPAFATPDSYFDLPQGDKWTKDREIVPLEGELPDMAGGLMQKAHADLLYWRVVGRASASGVQAVSQASPFNIRRAAGSGPSAQRLTAPQAPASLTQPPPSPPAPTVPPPQPIPAPARPLENR